MTGRCKTKSYVENELSVLLDKVDKLSPDNRGKYAERNRRKMMLFFRLNLAHNEHSFEREQR